MEGFSFAARGGSYAEDGARPSPPGGSQPRACDSELNVGPGHPKCLCEPRPIIVQDYVRGRFPLATENSRCCADGQRPDVLLYLSAGAKPLVPKFQKERKQAAEGEPYKTARERKNLRKRGEGAFRRDIACSPSRRCQ